jgi:hypothetical protein
MMLLKEYQPSTSRCHIDWKFRLISKYVICCIFPDYCFTLLDWLQLIYDDQLERLKEKEQKEAKKRQRLGENFSDLLYSIKVLQLIVSMLHYFYAIAWSCYAWLGFPRQKSKVGQHFWVLSFQGHFY